MKMQLMEIREGIVYGGPFKEGIDAASYMRNFTQDPRGFADYVLEHCKDNTGRVDITRLNEPCLGIAGQREEMLMRRYVPEPGVNQDFNNVVNGTYNSEARRQRAYQFAGVPQQEEAPRQQTQRRTVAIL